jgi:hypothetical protein
LRVIVSSKEFFDLKNKPNLRCSQDQNKVVKVDEEEHSGKSSTNE